MVILIFPKFLVLTSSCSLIYLPRLSFLGTVPQLVSSKFQKAIGCPAEHGPWERCSAYQGLLCNPTNIRAGHWTLKKAGQKAELIFIFSCKGLEFNCKVQSDHLTVNLFFASGVKLILHIVGSWGLLKWFSSGYQYKEFRECVYL